MLSLQSRHMQFEETATAKWHADQVVFGAIHVKQWFWSIILLSRTHQILWKVSIASRVADEVVH